MSDLLDPSGRRDGHRSDDIGGEFGADPRAPVGDLAGNDAVLRRQRVVLLGAAALLVGLAGFWIFSGERPNEQSARKAADADIAVRTQDLSAGNLSEQEWIALSENKLRSQGHQLQRLQGEAGKYEQLQAQIDALRSERQQMVSDGSRVVEAYESENEDLRRRAASAEAEAASAAAGPRSLYGATGPASYEAPVSPGAAPRRGELKVINFAPGAGAGPGPGPGASAVGNGLPAGKGNTVFTDSPNYLPANSFAKARVIVGVDAAANVQSQSDPLPVVLRITGPARSVADRGRVLSTRIEGCLVNGAARGDLSSEKVYVRLARMTCAQPGGRYAESEVKGFIAFGGKSGVRGRVVSREGSLATQAFFAGLVGGIGRGFSANANAFLRGSTVASSGERDTLSTGDIIKGGLGEGVSAAGDRVSEYLIERAEQYQPVIEMPTGIEVEIVFLDGAFIRN